MSQDFDVFLSYNSHDKSTVRELATRLTTAGLTVWLDDWELVPGRPWQLALEEYIERVRSVAVLVGSEGIGPWQQAEMRAFLSESVTRGIPVIPVLLPGAPSRIDLPLFLQSFTWVDFRGGFSTEPFTRLVWGITGRKPGISEAGGSSDSRTYESTVIQPKLEEVFKTVGLPQFTYIEPNIYRKFAYTVRVPGQHIVLEGPSGVGKSCLVFRVFQELGYKRDEDYGYFSAREHLDGTRIASLIQSLSSPELPTITVIDDLHLLPQHLRRQLADQLKLMSDSVFGGGAAPKCILIGIPASSSSLLYNAIDLGARLVTFKVESATTKQLHALISGGEERLSIRFRDRDAIINESNGSFYLCQLMCQEICFTENILETQQDVVILRYRIEDVRRELMRQLYNRYHQHLIHFCLGTKDRFEESAGFLPLLASVARIHKSVIHRHEILLDAGPYGPNVSNALKMVYAVLTAGGEDEPLSRLFHYDPSIEIFSIEDPAFRYYLNHLEIGTVLGMLGLNDTKLLSHYSASSSVSAIDILPLVEDGDTQQKQPDSQRDLVFVSYSHADAKWMERLRIHLTPLVEQNVLSLWSDTQIRAGSEWLAEIGRAVDSAKIAVLLVSANYLASEFITDHELPQLLAQAENGGLRIIWVPINHCFWESTPIARFQAAIDPRRPLAALTTSRQEKMLVQISRAISQALEASTGG